MNMTFDPPPTAEQSRNKSRQSAHRLPSFTSSRRSPSQEPPAYTTDDILAYKHQKYSKLVSWLRIALSAITLAVSVAIVACSGSSLRAYSGSGFAGEWWLPIWPLSVDLRPTHAVLACGIVLLSASLIYLAAALFPSVIPSHRLETTQGPANKILHSPILNSTSSTSPRPCSPYFAFLPRSLPLSLQLRLILTFLEQPLPPLSSHGPVNGRASKTRRPVNSARYAPKAWWLSTLSSY